MPNANSESVGGIRMDAEIELGGFEQSVKKLNQMVQSVDTRKAEQSFLGMEKQGKAAAGSIEALSERAKVLRAQLERLDPDTKKFTDTAKRLNIVLSEMKTAQEKAAKATVGMRDGMQQSAAASKVLGVTLGVLGAQSIEAVVFKMINLGREAVRLAITLDGVQSRAQAVFGDGFSRVSDGIDRVADAARRSQSDLLEMATGFGTLLDSAGATQEQVERFSVELSNLAVTLGKAHPDRSDVEIYSQLEAGILGNVRGLRQLGIVMTNKALQDFADSKNIRLKIADMTDEQLVVLRSQFLLDQTTKLQDAAAASNGRLGDTLKTTAARWKDLLETLGTNVAPFLNAANKLFLDMLDGWIGQIVLVKNVLIDFLSLGSASSITRQKQQLDEGAKTAAQNAAFQQQHGIGLGAARKQLLPGEFQKQDAEDFWAKRPGLGGGGGRDTAEAEAKKNADEMARIEQDILKTFGEQAKSNAERVRTLRDELLLRQRLGTLTKEEEATLQRLNRRTEFQTDQVEEATRAWEKQVTALERVEDKIADINQRIQDEGEELKKTLAEIDADTARSKQEKLAEMVKELREAETKLDDGNTSGEERLKLEARKRELEAVIDPLRLTAAGQEKLRAADDEASLDPFQKIEREAERKKKEAAEESNARVEGLQTELFQAQNNRETVVRLEAEKRDAVLSALSERAEKTTATYKKIEEDTAAHVKTQIEQFNALQATISSASPVSAVARVKKADGGMIYGPGGPTDDMVPALLSNGEFVVRAAAVQVYRPLLEAINSLSVPRFAQGGAVSSSVDNSRVSNITVNNHGEAARVMAHPSMYSWHARRARY